MKILKSSLVNEVELPLQLNISFRKVFDLFEKYAHKKSAQHPFHSAAIEMVKIFEQHPLLHDGFSDYSLLEKYKKEIDLILNPLFPEPLLLNEIKTASIPFSFVSFKFTDRFQNILNNAGNSYEFKVRNFENESMYILSCTFILSAVYGYSIDIKRPFYFDIPDKTSGTMKYYRAAFNADFSEITPTKNAPDITKEDFRELLNNFDNIDLWKEKFPPNSYIFKGFGLLNLFDVTSEEMLSSIKENLLASGDNLIFKLQNNLRDFYAIKDLKLGYSVFDNLKDKLCETIINKSNSIILNNKEEINCASNYFCENIVQKVFVNHETFVISDFEDYGKHTNKNLFYHSLQNAGIQSIILIPIRASKNGDLALLEIASPKAYDLNVRIS
jgi:hypothetical protein